MNALLLDAFGTVLDWRAPFRQVNEDALRRAHATAHGAANVPPFAAWYEHYATLRAEERAALDPDHRERDYRARFVRTFERAGATKKQARVLGGAAADRYFTELALAMRLAPDATPEFWRALPQGLRIVLVSNYGDGPSMEKAMDRLGVFFRFDATVITGNVGYLKPHPKVFETALDAAGVPAAECLMVGDDPVRDVMGAHALGIRGALVANPRPGLLDPSDRGEPPADLPAVARMATLAELPALLARL